MSQRLKQGVGLKTKAIECQGTFCGYITNIPFLPERRIHNYAGYRHIVPDGTGHAGLCFATNISFLTEPGKLICVDYQHIVPDGTG